MLKNIEETMAEIVINGNWYLVYSNYKWWIRTNVFKSLLYNFIEKSKIDIRNNKEGGMFEALEKKQDYK